jgi:hypothetical protein
MPIRKLTAMGGDGSSTTYGVSLDKGDLEVDGILDDLESGEEVRAVISREDVGEYSVKVLGTEDHSIPAQPQPADD